MKKQFLTMAINRSIVCLLLLFSTFMLSSCGMLDLNPGNEEQPTVEGQLATESFQLGTSVTPKYPSYLPASAKTEGILQGVYRLAAGFATFWVTLPVAWIGGQYWGPILVASIINFGTDEANVSSFVDDIQWSDWEKKVGIVSSLNVNLFQRKTGDFDILFKIHNTYQPGFIRKNRLTVGFYQDVLSFTILPTDATCQYVNLNSDFIFPETNAESIGYSYTTSWNADAGLSKDGPSAGGGFSQETSCSTETNDFNILTNINLEKKGVSWVSNMLFSKDPENDNAPNPYSTENPASLKLATTFINADIDKWFSNPADRGQNALDMEYSAGYTVSENQKGKVLEFKFFSMQRLMYGSIEGAGDIAGVPWTVFGSVVMIPYVFVTEGIIRVDLDENTITLTDIHSNGYTIKDIKDHPLTN
jgi:hypothetical protein